MSYTGDLNGYYNIDGTACDNFGSKQNNHKVNENTIEVQGSSKYEPYANILEYVKAEKRHGPWIISKDKSEAFKSIEYEKKRGLLFSGSYYKNFETIFEDYIWQDGTPCGKLKKAK